MDSGRWEQIQSLFHEAAGYPEPERRSFVETASGGDQQLMDEVLAMLAADDRSASLLDRGLHGIAYQMVGASAKTAPSQEFGPYRLVRILGEGGMGVVWLAERADAGNLVAIKFLLHAELSPARRERFAREIKTLAKLKHSFIARLYDAGTLEEGTPWFVMEYVEGQPFTEYCRAEKRTMEEQLRLFLSVCETVQYAHGQEIIHRDLKPSNILVEKDGTPRLLDFGIARELQGLDEPSDRTRPGLRFMSPDYAAPEWVRDGIVGFYTDVYSLGVMLYEMLTGRLPFAHSKSGPELPENHDAANAPEKPSVAARRAEGQPGSVQLASLTKTAWSDLDVLCLKAMHEDPHERYQSVESLIRDLNHYLKHEPLEARPDTVRYRLNKFLQRNRRAVLATSVALVISVGLITFFSVRLAKARNAALAEAVRTQNIQRFMLNLLGDGDQEAAPSGDMKVVTLLDRGVKEADTLKSDPETQAELYQSLGTMYDRLGQFQKAEKLLPLALEETKAALGAENPRVAKLLIELGTLRGDQAQPKEAERLVREAVDLASRHLPADDPLVLQANAVLGRVLVEGGSYDKAIAILEPIARRQPSGEAAYAVRDSLSTLAVAEQYTGHLDVAESSSRRVVALDRQLLGESHPQTGFDMMNLGSVKATEGEYPEAESIYRQAIDIIRAWYGPDHPDVATSNSILARSLMVEGKYAEAEAVLEQVLKNQERNYGEVHDRIAFTLDTMGKIAVKRGDLAAAKADFSRALAIDRTLLGDGNYQTALIKADLGDIYARESQYAQAETMLREAVQAIEPLPPGNPYIGLARARWGSSLLHLKRYKDAEKQLLAAYEAMKAMHNPSLGQIHEVREDLVTLYEAQNQQENAKKYRAEIAAAEASAAKVPAVK
jgi:eukaryotic-like serine/threonine-protein kinase